ncbi:MAG: HNH endonuclease [Chloroflexi bacterium]|nr:HNH endonuclease [Chloroflexota bacterium]
MPHRSEHPLPRDWDRRREFVIARDGHRCAVCGRYRRLEVDHVTPREQGGSDDPRNLQAICRPCHEAKTLRENGGEPVDGQADWNEYAARRVRRAF